MKSKQTLTTPLTHSLVIVQIAQHNMENKEMTDEDFAAIGELVQEGYTSGILDGEGYRVSWSLTTEKFDN